MTRFAAPAFTLCTALLLAGCWGGDADTGPSSTSGPAPQESVTSRFFAGTPSHIETVIIDPLPVESAHLVTADGTMIAAKEILREKNAYADQGDNLPHVAVGAAGGSQSRVSTGIGIEFPLFGGGGPAPRAVSMTTSTITLIVPDLAVYDATWQHWILHIDLGDGANHRSIETLPPRPPR
ncbi:MAG TPA: hypothetical protein VHE77_13920 [Dongiaceae bacterium]|jgi:hypothetical protein|nr:hypothetical protein [Dongiaceae bacterium]